MLNKILKGDTALLRGIRTAIQAVIGFVTGLLVVVWGVPGVPEAVEAYFNSHFVELLVAFGFSTGLAAFLWNVARKDVKNF